MSQLLTISQITQEALPVLRNKLALSSAVNREYSNQFAKSGAKIGNVVNVRKPPRYTVSTGPALDLQDSVETFVPVTLTNQDHIDIPFSSQDLTLSVDDYRERFIVPAMTALANKIDANGHQLYKKVANHNGTVGSLSGGTLNTAALISSYVLTAKQYLLENGVPDDDNLAFLVNPASQTQLVSNFTNLFNPSGTISRQFTRGAMGDGVLGFNFAATQNVAVHTYGTKTTASATYTTAGAAQSGNTGPGTDATASFSLSTTVAAGDNGLTLTAGTVITINGVFEVNPQNRVSVGRLKQFVITQDATLATGTQSIQIWPAPVFSGQFQNAFSTTGNIAASSTITVPNTSASLQAAQNLAFHPSALTLATADLELINDGATSSRADYDGISLRALKTYIPGSDQAVLRLDVLYGWQAVYPELAVRNTA